MILFFAFFTEHAWPQSQEDYISDLKKTGNLFSVKLTPADKFLKVYVTGHNIGQVDLKKMDLKASSRNGKFITALPVSREEDYFLIHQSLKKPSDLILDISNSEQSERLEIPYK